MVHNAPHLISSPRAGTPLSVRDLTCAFDAKVVLRSISFDVNRGEIFSVMGMSGCGKSTLLRCILGLLKPASGQIAIQGVPIVGLKERELNEVRLKMGMCFQYSALFDSMTVADNVAFALRRHTKLSEEQISDIVAERLEVVGMAGTEEMRPTELSGGMRKRVCIARALALEPQIMLYDEPAAGLDPIMTQVINDLMLHLRDGYQVTSIVVSHDVEALFAVADRVIMLHDGRIEAMGTAAELRQSDNEVVQQFIHGHPTGPIVA